VVQVGQLEWAAQEVQRLTAQVRLNMQEEPAGPVTLHGAAVAEEEPEMQPTAGMPLASQAGPAERAEEALVGTDVVPAV
jgi:hypothetical protein